LQSKALNYYEQGNFKKSEKLYRKLLICEEDGAHKTYIISEIACACKMQNKFAEAEQLFKECLKKMPDDHPRYLSTMMHLASVYSSQGKVKEADIVQKTMLAKQKSQLDMNQVEYDFDVVLQRAVTLNQQHRYAEAERLYKACFDEAVTCLGDKHPDILKLMLDIANNCFYQAKFSEAEQRMKKCLDKHVEVLGENHPETLGVAFCLAAVLLQLKKYKESEIIQQIYLEKMKLVLGENHTTTITSTTVLANTLAEQGKFKDAEVLYKQCYERLRKTLGEEHQFTITAKKMLLVNSVLR